MGAALKSGKQSESDSLRYSKADLGRLIESAVFHLGQSISFEVAGLPPTLNEMYLHRGHSRILKNEAREFRRKVFYLMGENGRAFRPGLALITVYLYSPRWLTKDGKLRNMDLDNRLKAILDAIEHASGMPDYRFMAIRALKIPSDTERTVVRMDAIKYP